jgi:hypothetical protein
MKPQTTTRIAFREVPISQKNLFTTVWNLLGGVSVSEGPTFTFVMSYKETIELLTRVDGIGLTLMISKTAIQAIPKTVSHVRVL